MAYQRKEIIERASPQGGQREERISHGNDPLDQVTLMTLVQAQHQQALNMTADRNIVANTALSLTTSVQQITALTMLHVFGADSEGLTALMAQQAAILKNGTTPVKA